MESLSIWATVNSKTQKRSIPQPPPHCPCLLPSSSNGWPPQTNLASPPQLPDSTEHTGSSSWVLDFFFPTHSSFPESLASHRFPPRPQRDRTSAPLTTPPSSLFSQPGSPHFPFPHIVSGSGGPGVHALRKLSNNSRVTARPPGEAHGHSPSIPRGGGSGCPNRKRPLHCLQFPWLLRGS